MKGTAGDSRRDIENLSSVGRFERGAEQHPAGDWSALEVSCSRS